MLFYMTCYRLFFFFYLRRKTMERIRSIAIVFGDNDFGITFMNLLDTIKNVLLHDDTIPEDVLETIIRKGILFHYIAFQNRYQYKHDKTFEEEFTRIGEYLSGIKILFDGHAELAYENEDHDSGAWFLDVTSGKIMSF